MVPQFIADPNEKGQGSRSIESLSLLLKPVHSAPLAFTTEHSSLSFPFPLSLVKIFQRGTTASPQSNHCWDCSAHYLCVALNASVPLPIIAGTLPSSLPLYISWYFGLCLPGRIIQIYVDGSMTLEQHENTFCHFASFALFKFKQRKVLVLCLTGLLISIQRAIQRAIFSRFRTCHSTSGSLV